MSLGEFEIIQEFFTGIGQAPGILVSVGDDCAVIKPSDHPLAVSIDTQVVGVHFPESAAPMDIAHRALGCAVSDLAAMGAMPFAFTLALTLPRVEHDWLQGFAEGLRAAAQQYQMALIGGDTTRGPALTVTIQVHGRLAPGQPLLRKGAQPGHSVFVSGTLGDAAAALAQIQQPQPLDIADHEFLMSRFYHPEARVALGQSLRGIASAAIDISDGLLADAGHIARASDVGIELDAAQLPLSDAILKAYPLDQARLLALTGGDDYELCFTAPANRTAMIERLGSALGVPVTAIGRVVAASGVTCLDEAGQPVAVESGGYRHF